MCTRPAQAVTSLRKPARSPTISRFPPAGPQCLRQPALPRVPTPSCSPQARHPSPIRPARFLPAGFPPASRLSPSRPALPKPASLSHTAAHSPPAGSLSSLSPHRPAFPEPARYPQAGPPSQAGPPPPRSGPLLSYLPAFTSSIGNDQQWCMASRRRRLTICVMTQVSLQ